MAKKLFYIFDESDWNTKSRMLHLAPISHGSGMFVVPAFFAGGCNITLNEPDLAQYCQVASRSPERRRRFFGDFWRILAAGRGSSEE